MTFEKVGEYMYLLYNPLIGIAKVIGIFVAASLIIKVGVRIIKKTFEKQKSFKYNDTDKVRRKINTLSTLTLSIYKYAMYIVTGMCILMVFTNKFDLSPLLAVAGIGGVALGLGSQSLIKDIISGVFVLIEDQYAVGDSVTIDSMTGTVEKFELKTTRVRNSNGDLYIIPNGEVKKIVNHTRGKRKAIVDVPIGNSADIDKVFAVLEEVCESAGEQLELLNAEKPKLEGIVNLSRDGANIRIIIAINSNNQSEVEREIRKLIMQAFKLEGIGFSDA